MRPLLVLLCTMLAAFAQISTLAQNIPPCLSTCMTPFPASHSPETCRANWTSTISACIDRACSVSVSSSADADIRTSMFFVPKHDASCQGAGQSLSTLQLQPGICQTISNRFQSFVVSHGQNSIQQNCSLGLFEESECAGGAREVLLDHDDSSNGQCWSVGGHSVMLSCGEGGDISDNQAAHSFLSSLCRISSHSTTHTLTSSGLPSSMTLVAADTSIFHTTFTTLAFTNSTATNYSDSINDDPAAPANATSRTTSSIAVIIPSIVPVSGPMSGDSLESEQAVKRNGAAQWALVVVVFARSLMF